MPNVDTYYLQKALTLAKIRSGYCAPNPSVGAIIIKNNQILAEGYHYAAGEPHAEIEALKKINFKAEDTNVYVTLEPCCHTGKTPPCADALIKAGVKRVVYGYRDPNPLVAGKGEAFLKAAGIECKQYFSPEIDLFYRSYHHWQKTQLPFVTTKIALTLDGKSAGQNGQPIKISGPELKKFTHLARKNADAILTTQRTIEKDNPQLSARIDNQYIAKHLYIIDRELAISLNAKIFSTAQSVTLFHDLDASDTRRQIFTDQGVRCIPILLNESGLLDLRQVIQEIGHAGIHDLWVESGGTLFNALYQANLVNRAFIYIGLWSFGQAGTTALTSQIDFRNKKIAFTQFGKDVLCEITS